MSTISSHDQRCVEQLAFLLMNEPEERRGHLLAQAAEAIAKHGARQGWSDPVGYAKEFSIACAKAMCRHLEDHPTQ
jgi:hypothetical protein